MYSVQYRKTILRGILRGEDGQYDPMSSGVLSRVLGVSHLRRTLKYDVRIAD